MKYNAKIKKGKDLLFVDGMSLRKMEDTMIINFMDKYTFKSFTQKKNHLIINTTQGEVDLVFTGYTPTLEFECFEKDQLILKLS